MYLTLHRNDLYSGSCVRTVNKVSSRRDPYTDLVLGRDRVLPGSPTTVPVTSQIHFLFIHSPAEVRGVYSDFVGEVPKSGIVVTLDTLTKTGVTVVNNLGQKTFFS